MQIGKVVGNIWATRKHEGLEGHKLMVVRILDSAGKETGDALVAVDNIGAGVSDNVLIARGGASRLACHESKVPVDAAIVGIIDDLDVLTS